MWADHGRQVWCVRDGARHYIYDVSILKHWNHLHGHLHVVHDPVQVGLKQLLAKTCHTTEHDSKHREVYIAMQMTLRWICPFFPDGSTISDPNLVCLSYLSLCEEHLQLNLHKTEVLVFPASPAI